MSQNSTSKGFKETIVIALGIILLVCFLAWWLFPLFAPQLLTSTPYIPPTVDLGEVGKPYLPGQYVYKDGHIYMITSLELSQPAAAILAGRQFVKQKPADAAVHDHKLFIEQQLPPDDTSYHLFGKELVEIQH